MTVYPVAITAIERQNYQHPRPFSVGLSRAVRQTLLLPFSSGPTAQSLKNSGSKQPN